MTRPSVSVAMCTYNGARYVREQLQSIARQTLTADELVICDDGSQDQTLEMVTEFAACLAQRVRLERNSHALGCTGNFERAISLCSGDIIVLADQDDVWKADKLAIIAHTFARHPGAGYVFSDAEMVNEDGNRLGFSLWEALGFDPRRFAPSQQVEMLLKRNLVTGAAMAFRSSLRDLLQPIPPAWPHDYWVALLGSIFSSGVPISERLFLYRRHLAQPADHEHAWNRAVLAREEEEYRQAYRLLCPSEFVVQTFLRQGFPRERLLRHEYGFDETLFYPADAPRPARSLRVLFAGVCAVRKGLHFALEAWLRSPAHHEGTFLIAGEFLPAYARKLAYQLSHPSIHVLGNRNDLPQLMRQSDVLVLPSIEEGFGLVCAEAMGSGCVPLVSDACTEICVHMANALVHHVGDVDTLSRHLTMLHQDRDLLRRLRAACLRQAPQHTWTAAGIKLLQAYRQAIAEKAAEGTLAELQACA